jgi:hypothetical protein
MRDLGDTRHHTLRRSIGNREFEAAPNFQKATSKKKFPADLEIELDKHMPNFSVKHLSIKLGRKEVEDQIIRVRKPVFNKTPKRGT